MFKGKKSIQKIYGFYMNRVGFFFRFYIVMDKAEGDLD